METFTDQLLHVKRALAQDAANNDFRQHTVLDICDVFSSMHYSSFLVAFFEKYRSDLYSFIEYLDQFERRAAQRNVELSPFVKESIQAAHLRFFIFENKKVRKIWEPAPPRLSSKRMRERIEKLKGEQDERSFKSSRKKL